jgi:penicillin-binding protein 2
MRYKRTIAVFFTIILFFAFLLVRICLLMSGADSERLAFITSQQETKIKLYESRGQIYDINLSSLTDRQSGMMAVIDPFLAKDEEKIKNVLEPSEIARFNELYKANRPFSICVRSEINEIGVSCFSVPQRYSLPFNSSHLLGYVDSKGEGVNGIEKAYDSFLNERRQGFHAIFSVDAARRAISGLGMKTEGELKQNKSGVVLTIDSGLQKIADDAADTMMTSGAIVILDIKTGEIRAMSSRPNFNPNNVKDAFLKDEGAFVNRAITAYNVGSVFKIAVTAASLETGWTGDTFYCGGSIKVGQNEISCQKKEGHGKIDLNTAFAQSCNVYFIELAKKTGADAVLNMAVNMGFGNECTLAPNLISKKGNLPTLKNLSATAALANFAIGQGEFMATPLQIAQMVSVVAGDG